MFRVVLTIVALSVVVAGVTHTGALDAYAQDNTNAPSPFITLGGKAGPDAIPIKVWTKQVPDESGKGGERLLVRFKAEKSCYLVVANVTAKGDVQILFPFKDKDVINNHMDAGKEYTLFSEGSRLKLNIDKNTPKAHLVFFVSPKPTDFVKIGENEIVMKVPVDKKEAQKTLREQMEKMASQKGFNRHVLAIKTEKEGDAGLHLMGAKVKGVGWKDQSESPEAVTGAAGWKDESETPEAVAGAPGRSNTPKVK